MNVSGRVADDRHCRLCGHEHRSMASARLSTDAETSYFCHEDDHSCYMRRTRNFDPSGPDREALEAIRVAMHEAMSDLERDWEA